MSQNAFSFARLVIETVLRSHELGETLQSKDITSERWLFVVPHDDDLVIGGGLWVEAALDAGVDVHAVVVTDGRMGYCRAEDRETIVDVRRREMLESCRQLGIDVAQVHFLGFPDCGLVPYQGRRAAQHGEPEIAGFTGLQNALTHYLRRVRPLRVIVPSAADLHPDHKITYSELMISLFHASGKIWPELGEPHPVPELYEMAVYCDFCSPPNLEVRTLPDPFEQKLSAIAAFQSQAQIEQLVEQVRRAGPCEYLRHVDFHFYCADQNAPLFQ